MDARLRLAALTSIAGLGLAMAVPAQASTSAGAWTFVSAPSLHPPKLQVRTRSKSGLARGDFLAANLLPQSGTSGTGPSGPMILDRHARPLWFLPAKGHIYEFQQETYEGHPVLTWLQGGKLILADEHYRRIAVLTAPSPWAIGIHDCSIIGGDVWVTVFRILTDQDLSPYGGSRHGNIVDEGVEEFQISTGHEVGLWDAFNPGGRPNVSPASSEVPAKTQVQLTPGGPEVWDPYHLNAVQSLPDGDLLVSMRNTWAVYLLDPIKSRIIWTLGGKRSTFGLGPGASFSWQHDARLVDPQLGGHGTHIQLTLFNDNNGDSSTQNPSEGMVLSLNTASDRATLIRAYRHTPPLAAAVLGSMQLLPNGNALVGWGSEPYFSEYSPSGQVLLDVRWPGANASYRVLLTRNWVGTPFYPPSGAARGRIVYASWNGATQVAQWQVLAGPSASHLTVVATHVRTGFETAVRLAQGYATYEVRAVDAHGTALGTSKPFS